jgi:predicted CXXCH cytochrome family protein
MQKSLIHTAALLVFTMLVATSGFSDVANSKHNLSVSGPGGVKATSESQICIFCHAPHTQNGAYPLWNKTLPPLAYTPYSSTTMQATPGQPTYSSKLCLSCHDGTIALGSVSNRSSEITMTGPLGTRANLTTDLSNDHPISFVYDNTLATADQELVNPATLTGPVQLDEHGQLQCSSCHDAHSEADMFLVMDNAFSALCKTCHVKPGWDTSSHSVSTATWNGSGVDPWPHTSEITVASNACENCHSPHAAGVGENLLGFATEEANCTSCHNGNVASTDIATDIAVRVPPASRHPVDQYTGVHSLLEDFNTMPRHVECHDCHNPHNVTTGDPLGGVGGVALDGSIVSQVSVEYELCFKCHADNPNVPPPPIIRQIIQPNIRKKFDTANPSFHPVAGPGTNPDVPSLIPPWTEASTMLCSDCHASDTGAGAGGGGPAGPHGSQYHSILEREHNTAEFAGESAALYALCYKCHDRAAIIGDVGFSKHSRHVDKVSCTTCHDPHGISHEQGNTTNNVHLINFDTTIILPGGRDDIIEYLSFGPNDGECTLTCHGTNHRGRGY